MHTLGFNLRRIEYISILLYILPFLSNETARLFLRMPSASLRHRRRRRHTNRKINRSSHRSRSNNRRTPAHSAKKRKVRRSTMQRRRAAARIERSVRRTDVRKRQHHKRGNHVVRKSCCGGQPSNFVVTARYLPDDSNTPYEFEAKKPGPNSLSQFVFRTRVFKLYDTLNSDIMYLEYFTLPDTDHPRGVFKGMFNFTKNAPTVSQDNPQDVLIQDFDHKSTNRTYTIRFKDRAELIQFMNKAKNGVESTAIPQQPNSNPTAAPVPVPAPVVPDSWSPLPVPKSSLPVNSSPELSSLAPAPAPAPALALAPAPAPAPAPSLAPAAAASAGAARPPLAYSHPHHSHPLIPAPPYHPPLRARPVIFFDNNPVTQNDEALPTGYYYVQVNKTHYRPFCTKNVWKSYTQTLSSGAKEYVNLLSFGDLGYNYDPKSGISRKQFQEWKPAIVGNKSDVVLEWDRTLTLFERMTHDRVADIQALWYQQRSDANSKPPTPADLAEVYFGGATRVKHLREFLTSAHNAGCKLTIQTRNPRAYERNSGRPLFHELLTACVGGDGSDATWVERDIELIYVPQRISKYTMYNAIYTLPEL